MTRQSKHGLYKYNKRRIVNQGIETEKDLELSFSILLTIISIFRGLKRKKTLKIGGFKVYYVNYD